jgi:hypothetical protein
MVLDCPPDAAWRAIRSPSVLMLVSAPFTTFESLEPDGFPKIWPAGVHRAKVSALALVQIGEQTIDISYPVGGASGSGSYKEDGAGDGFGPGDIPRAVRAGGVRMMRDTGRGVSGALKSVTKWQHTMAVSDADGGRTLYRDRLVFEVGALTPLAWPLYWGFWQWRALRIRRLSRTWK